METNRQKIMEDYVVRNFRSVVKNRDTNKITKKLYEFLMSYCGFIAHYNIHGFKRRYSGPNFVEFLEKVHRATWIKKSWRAEEGRFERVPLNEIDEIKAKLREIVEENIDEVRIELKELQRAMRHALYLTLKEEFGPSV